MKLLDAKRNIEQFFMDNYDETIVHWAGMKFDIKGKQEWVYFEYLPTFVSDSGLDNTKYAQDGTVRISVIARNPFRCSEVADIILDLFKGQEISGMFAKKVNILSQDYIEDIDKTALELDIYLTTY